MITYRNTCAACRKKFPNGCGKHDEMIRVYMTEPTNFADEKVGIKIFSDRKKAGEYFKKCVVETREDAKETDDTLGVVMEDVRTGKILRDKYYSMGGKDEEGTG